jgi:hypothetical protein
MNKSNILYVDFKDEAERSRLVSEYEMYGYFVTTEAGRLRVSSKAPAKVEKKSKRVDKRDRD